MPKKKGKKGGKLSKMTEEERILYLEQKALAEEEMRKKKEEILMMFLKDKLDKEEKHSHINLLKINRQWRNILRMAKSESLQEEIKVLKQTFERVVDRKNNVIKSLSTDADEADEQYNVSLRSHLHNVDDLIDHHRRRISSLEEDFNDNLHTIRTEFDHEKELIADCHSHEIDKIQDTMFALEENHIESENEAKQEFHSLRDEVKNKNLEEKHVLKVQLENAVESLWKQFQNSLKNYNEQTADRKSAFEALRDKDERSAREIDTQMKRLQKIQEKMFQLRMKMQQNAKECDARNKEVREQKEVVQMRYQWLKSELNELRETERESLTRLTVQSNAAIKKLTKVAAKGERILKLAEMCRKYETEEEKVVPFYATSLTEDEEDDAEVAYIERPTEPLAAVIHDYTSLENFWKRYNKVLLDELAVEREKADLTQENFQLRSILKQYLDGISVNQEVMKEENPLLVINHRTNIKFPVSDRRVVRNVIELKHVAKILETRNLLK